MNKEIKAAREKLLSCSRPIFLFDNDPDGLASFLLLYRMIREGKGMAEKGDLGEEAAKRVNAYIPDLVVILDKAKVDDEFFDIVKAPCIWIDHHEVQEVPQKVIYLNPRKEGINKPTSQLAYEISEEDEWIAVTGIVSDWMLPPKELWDKFNKEYKDYLPKKIKNEGDALYKTKIGRLARIFSFNLKGRATDVLTSIKILTRIKGPDELLEKKHSQARLIMKKYEQKLNEYEEIIKTVKVDKNDPLILFTYDNGNSFTTDLANELLYKNPDKIIIIARETGGSYKCSLRAFEFRLDKLLEEVLSKINGRGGGHEHACGAVIESEDFEEFIRLLRESSKDS